VLRARGEPVQMGVEPGAEVPDEGAACGCQAETIRGPLDQSVDILGNDGIGLAP